MSIRDDEPCNVWWHSVMLDNGIQVAKSLIKDCATVEDAVRVLDQFAEDMKEHVKAHRVLLRSSPRARL